MRSTHHNQHHIEGTATAAATSALTPLPSLALLLLLFLLLLLSLCCLILRYLPLIALSYLTFTSLIFPIFITLNFLTFLTSPFLSLSQIQIIKPNLSELRVLVAEGLAAGYTVENGIHVKSIIDGTKYQTVDGREESESGDDSERDDSVMFLNDVYTLARALLQIMDGSYTTVNDKMHYAYRDTKGSVNSRVREDKKQYRRDVVITLGHRGVVWCTSEEHSEEHSEGHSGQHFQEHSVELENTLGDQFPPDRSGTGNSYLKTKRRRKGYRDQRMYTYTYTYTHTPPVPLGIHSSGTFNTNGAGDAFCSGLIHHIIQHDNDNNDNTDNDNQNKNKNKEGISVESRLNVASEPCERGLKITQFSIDAGLRQAYMKIISSATPPPV